MSNAYAAPTRPCTAGTAHRDVQALQVQQREEQVESFVGEAATKAEVLQAPQVLTAQQGAHQVEAANRQHTQAIAGSHS